MKVQLLAKQYGIKVWCYWELNWEHKKQKHLQTQKKKIGPFGVHVELSH
jgi:hypothetical protein